MTLNLLFFTITIKPKKMTVEEALHQEFINKIHEENVNKVLEYRVML
ncbi:YrzI family small protein [Peribacillus tepidiphilus]|nr:YrzI family small protein [Peribacillus tepidiphilus]